MSGTTPSRLFIGTYPEGFVYADRQVEEHGDYRRLAFFSFRRARLEDLAADCPAELVGWIRAHAAKHPAGTVVQTSASGQTHEVGR